MQLNSVKMDMLRFSKNCFIKIQHLYLAQIQLHKSCYGKKLVYVKHKNSWFRCFPVSEKPASLCF